LFVAWNIISFLSAKKLFKDEEDLREVVIYDENYKKQVRRYRNVNYISFIILLGSFALMILWGNGYVSEGVARTLFPILLFTGLISLFITVFYFSGLKNISANEIVVYPFQFINDPLLKKQLLEKKIKFYKRSIYIISIIFIMLYILNIFDAKALVVGFLVGTSTVPYKIRQLKSMIN
jgi:hypothetical protein